MPCGSGAEVGTVIVALAGLIIGIVGFFVLAMRRAPRWQWAGGALILGIISRISVDGGLWLAVASPWTGIALLPAIILGLLSVTAIRRVAVAAPAYGLVKSILPRVSRTELEALDAGTVGWDAELFSGRPDWD